MSMGMRGKTTNLPREAVAVQAQAERESMWGEMTGTIKSFDPVKQIASVQPDYKPRHNGSPVDMPQLEEVPVRFPRAGGFVMTYPVKVGDKVTLRPQMRSSEEFHTGGDYTPVDDTRSFSLSDMEAFLDGGEALTSPIPNFNTTNMEMRSEDGQFAMEMSPEGKFSVRGSEGNWFDLLAQLAELLASDTLIILHGSSSGNGHQLEFKVQYAEIAAKLRGMTL